MFYDPEDNDSGSDAGGRPGDDSPTVDPTQDYDYEDLDYGLREGDASGWERRDAD